MKHKRLQPYKRKFQILAAAIKVAKIQGYRQITREEVAAAAQVSEALINTYYGSIQHLRRCVILQAIKDEIPEIIAQHLVVTSDNSIEISPRLRKIAAEYVRLNYAQSTDGI